MARKRDNSPCPNTCPLIDEAIEVLRNSECGYNTDVVNSAIDALEKVRSYNAELRTWGNEQHERADDAEAEVQRLERLIE